MESWESYVYRETHNNFIYSNENEISIELIVARFVAQVNEMTRLFI